MIYLAKFKKPDTDEEDEIRDVFIDADTGDEALEMLKRHGIDDEVARLVEVPRGVFCCDVRFIDEDEEAALYPDEDEESAGVILEVADTLGEFLELDAKASNVIDVAAGGR